MHSRFLFLFPSSHFTSHPTSPKINNTTTTSKVALPSELWMEVFRYINSFEQLIQCSLVNSRWKQLTEKAMYCRDIAIIDPMDAYVFYTFLKHNPTKSQVVKYLTVMVRDPSFGCYTELIPLILTHKIETFNGYVGSILFFKRLLAQTFGNEGIAKFSNLKSIPAVWTYNNMYDKLLRKLRYILEEITLNFYVIPSDTTALKWPTLCRLNKMAKVQVLNFNSYVNNVKRTEAILRNCGRSENLSIRLADEDLFGGETNIIQWIGINTQQHDTLKVLKVKIDKRYDPFFIDYLMYKYPNITSIIVEKADIKEP